MRYRIKTKEEFEKEFGENWKAKVMWAPYDEMDFLFGTTVPEDLVFDKVYDFKESGGWTIFKNMVVELPETKYRFKTKSEFEREFGENWRRGSIQYGWSERMDKFFGQDLPSNYDYSPKFYYGEWVISRDMVVEKSISRGIDNYGSRGLEDYIVDPAATSGDAGPYHVSNYGTGTTSSKPEVNIIKRRTLTVNENF